MFPYNQPPFSYINLFMLNRVVTQSDHTHLSHTIIPQTVISHEGNSLPSASFQQNEDKISEDRTYKTDKEDSKHILTEIDDKNHRQPSKQYFIGDEKIKKIEEKDVVKPKRPQKYLTERAFYMKQKLKSKQRTDKRILRTRPKQKLRTSSKVRLRSVGQKKQKQLEKTSSKIKSIKKEPVRQKDKKSLQKLQKKTIRQYFDGVANIPKKIVGIWKINQFCRIKMQNFLKRRIVV